MKDVARLAGVSAMTVSRAMRDPEGVSPDTLKRVQRAIAKSGYAPNRIASSFSSNRTSVVALIVPSLRNALYAEMIQGISDVLLRNNLHLMISDCGFDLQEEEKLVAEYIAQRVRGLILHNTKHTERTLSILRSSSTVCVETGNLTPTPIDMVVSYSNYAAGKAIAEHLLSLGYRRLAFASLPVADSDRLRQRRNGFIAGLRKAGVSIDPSLILETGVGLASGAQAIVEILERAPNTQAVFFAGDVLAAGAILECQRRGWAVPKQIAIAASDDNDLMQHTVPPITTVAFPRYEIGVRSAEMIVARAQGLEIESPRIDMGFTVIRRGST